MSADGDDGGPGEREVAHRLFAAEFEDAAFEYSESDEDRAPNYVVTPTGARVNRLFVAGVLTEVETVNEDTLRGRVVDPTGAFVTYAGQYQPDEVAFLDRTTPPAFVSLAGKGRTFQPDDSDVVYTSVRPERLNEVDADTRDAWVVDAARATLRRVGVMAAAREFDERGDALRERLVAAGVDDSLAAGVPLALDHYGTTAGYLEGLREVAVQALGVVADEREEVAATTPDPDADGDTVGPLPAWARLDESAAATETDADTDASETDATGPDTDTSEIDTDGAETAVDATDSGQSAAPATETESTTATGDAPTESTASGGGEPAATTPTETATTTDSGGAPTESTASEPDPGETPTERNASDTEPETDTDDLGSFGDTGDASVGDTDGDALAGDATDGDSSTAAVADDSAPADDTDDLGSFDDTGGVTDDGGDLGSFEDSAGTEDDPATGADDTTGDPDDSAEAAVDPAEVDEDDLDDALTDEEREEVMAEHDVSFSTGTEVPDPEESDLDAPDPEEIVPDADETESTPAGTDAEPTETADAGGTTTAESAATTETSEDGPATDTTDTESETDPDDEGETPDLDDVNLTAAVVEVMDDLNDGDGVDREEVMAATVDRYGASPGDVEEAIQEALMNGQCYEAGGGLKPI